jgi:hypothetical protein
MYELKQLLIVLGLSAAPTAATVNIDFYKNQLKTEVTNEQNYQVELKAVEYKQMWVEVSVDDEGRKKLEKNKLHESEIMAKGRLMETRKKIKVLKYIIEQDSISKIKPVTSEL